ncbi:EamA family transporter RarD [Luteolibacter sp. SL250]|uniref:EamA family transporter RarD n=1 Tax=Luteolibacter sp. SL250 TaxID=2995170 RepID=UPI00226E2EF5|nr:EamA family transporter RarD [Luteolibacter sp. SL250]WAC21618.1 EamA family transporter RarD [Luteolibacter sp. SL250]
MNSPRSGVLAAIAAFFLWGVLPMFWKLLHFLPPISIVAQRTLWSLVILLLILRLRRETSSLGAGLRSPRAVFWHLLSGLMLSSNWLLYIWATLNNHIIEGALGYYLNPFFNMLFGALWFGERHSRGQLAAIAIAFCGVLLQVQAIGRFPWIAVTLAVTFSLYAVIRKRTPLGSLAGLTAETVLLAPLALGWLVLHSTTPADAFGTSPSQFLLVAATGVATAAPLLCFGYAARKISLTTLGILQFIGPTIQFLIGWLLYQEEMSTLRLVSFGLIWAAVSIYAWDSMRGRKTRSV